ncbi:hypothetical protein HGM15179_022118, partial [Zosterops borbonicus]
SHSWLWGPIYGCGVPVSIFGVPPPVFGVPGHLVPEPGPVAGGGGRLAPGLVPAAALQRAGPAPLGRLLRGQGALRPG